MTSEVGENKNADKLVKNKVLTKSMCFEYVLKKNMSYILATKCVDVHQIRKSWNAVYLSLKAVLLMTGAI